MTVMDDRNSKWEQYEHLSDHTSGWLTFVIGLVVVLYVGTGALFMSAHMEAGASILDLASVVRFVAMIFLWPLFVVGLIPA